MGGTSMTALFGGGVATNAAACVPQEGLIAEVQGAAPGWDGEQLQNAAAIMSAASQLGMTRRAKVH